MDSNELPSLLEAYTDGTLTPEQDQRLASLVQSDDSVAEQVAMIGWLGQGCEAVTGEDIVRSFFERVRAEGEAQWMAERAQSRRIRIRSQKKPRRRTWWLALPSAALLLFSIGLSWWLSSDDYARLEIQGQGLSVQRSIASGELLSINQGTATFRYDDDDSVLTLPGPGKIRLSKTANGAKHIELLTGQLGVSAAPQPAGRPMTVATPQARITVLGTRFTVSSQGSHTDCRVDYGEVEISPLRGGAAIRLKDTDRYRFLGDGSVIQLYAQAQDNSVGQWEDRSDSAEVFATASAGKVSLGAHDRVNATTRPMALFSQAIANDGVVVITGVMERGSVQDSRPYIEFSAMGYHKSNLRLVFAPQSIDLESRPGGTEMEQQAAVSYAHKQRYRFRLELDGDHIRAIVDDKLVYDGPHAMQTGDLLGFALRTEGLTGIGVCATFLDLSISRKLPREIGGE